MKQTNTKEMRGKLIDVIATKDNIPYFKVGDKLQVQSVLHDKRKLLVNATCGLFNSKDELILRIDCGNDLANKPVGEKVYPVNDYYQNHTKGEYSKKMQEATYAGVGTYNYSVIILADGTEYHGSILGNRTLAYAFDKV